MHRKFVDFSHLHAVQVDIDVSNDHLQLDNNFHHRVVDMDDTRELSSDAVAK